MIFILFAAVIFLAYANGANDNFKGVATLLGSRTTPYRQSLTWATLTTFAGSLTAILLSGKLIKAFSGKGLVPDVLVGEPVFLTAVACGAALTVFIATVVGLPISTTHALTGALVGTGFSAAGSIYFSQLGAKFVVPLLLSPFIAFALTACLYPLLQKLRLSLQVERQTCLCVEGADPEPIEMGAGGTLVLASTGVRLTTGQTQACQQRYAGTMLGIDAQTALDKLHYLSAGAVSFARGLNDTPKIVALLVASSAMDLSLPVAMFVVGAGMAIGGIMQARKVATTMSYRITPMNHGQGFTANMATAFLVLIASRWGVPVSTTHVSCGSLFGLGAVTGGARWSMIRKIILSWVGTLPLAAGLAWVVYRTLV